MAGAMDIYRAFSALGVEVIGHNSPRKRAVLRPSHSGWCYLRVRWLFSNALATICLVRASHKLKLYVAATFLEESDLPSRGADLDDHQISSGRPGTFQLSFINAIIVIDLGLFRSISL